jgi:hypothetical protein
MKNEENLDNYEYNQELPIYYTYKGKSHLKLDINNTLTSYDNVNIFAYNVNTSGKTPFKQVLLEKSEINSNLMFPSIIIFKNSETYELIEYTKICLFDYLMLKNYEIFNKLINFDGFYEYNNSLYLFFDVTKCKLELYDIYINSFMWFGLIDEIVNHRHICNIKVSDAVIQFFNYELDFSFLVDENDNMFELPFVGFVSKPEKKLNYTYVFGETKGDKNNILGPFYYFNNYYNAFNNAGDMLNENPEFKKTGIVRFALFLDNVKYIENYPNDPIDKSEIKQMRLRDTNLDQKFEYLTIRITDHDGKWIEKYNSVYLGNIKLDDGNILNKQIIVVKEYIQQVPLSYHYINKKIFEERKEDYLIL